MTGFFEELSEVIRRVSLLGPRWHASLIRQHEQEIVDFLVLESISHHLSVGQRDLPGA